MEVFYIIGPAVIGLVCGYLAVETERPVLMIFIGGALGGLFNSLLSRALN